MAFFKNKTVDQCTSVLSTTLAEHKEHMEIASAAFSEAHRAERVATRIAEIIS